ncbi:hypothetical protein HQ603_00005, partial [Rhodococcus corynebacterioides]|nr:hypothetical protein [Rhodococcus corynebacterioides]
MTTPVPHRILGLHVTDRAAAAVVLSAETGEMVRVPVVTDTVLHLLPDGSSSLTRPDPDTAPDGVDVVDRFVEHVGDPAGVVSAHGAVLRAEDLLATVLLHLIDRTRPDADVVAVAHPGTWTADQVAALRDSLEFLSLTGVELLPDTVLSGAPDEPLDVALAAARHAGGLAPPPAAAPTVVVPAGVGRRRLPVVLAAAAAAVALAAAVTGAIVVTADRTVAPEVPAIADAVPATGTSATAAPTTSRSTGPFPTVTAEDVAAVVPSVTAPRTPD